MKKIALLWLAVFTGVLVHAEIPDQIDFGGEVYQFTETQPGKGYTNYIFTANKGQTIRLSLDEKVADKTFVEHVAQVTFDVCDKSDGCSAYKDVCGQDDILVQTVSRETKNGAVFFLEFKRITPQGRILWQWDDIFSVSDGGKGIEKKLKAPLSTYRRAFCQLDVF